MAELDFNEIDPPLIVDIIIGDEKYSIAGTLSVDDFSKIIGAYNDGRTDYHTMVAEIIYRRIEKQADGRVTLDQVLEMDASYFISFIEATVLRGHLLDAYNSLNDKDDIFCRFILAVIETWKKTCIAIVETITEKIPQSYYVQAKKLIEETGKSVVALVRSLDQKIKEFSELYREPINNLLRGLSEFAKTVQGLKLTEEEKEALIQNYHAWGRIGWTINPEMPFSFFHQAPPPDQLKADEMALEFCGDNEIHLLFDRLHELLGSNCDDLDEAIFCFENQKYKSCIMVLFAAVDGLAIAMQTTDDINGKKKYPVGITAGRNVVKRFQAKAHDEAFVFALKCGNLLCCMEKMFEFTAGFTLQPNVINRNYIDHGMHRGIVSKKDCVQVFLFYYNFLSMVNWYQHHNDNIEV